MQNDVWRGQLKIVNPAPTEHSRRDHPVCAHNFHMRNRLHVYSALAGVTWHSRALPFHMIPVASIDMNASNSSSSGDWKNTLLRLQADYEQGKAAALSFISERQRQGSPSTILSPRSRVSSSLAAIAVVAFQWEAILFGLTFVCAWLIGTSPTSAQLTRTGIRSGWLSNRLVGATDVAVHSRVLIRPLRWLLELLSFTSLWLHLQKLEPPTQQQTLRERFLQIAAVLFALVMTIRAIDLQLLHGNESSLLPSHLRNTILGIGAQTTSIIKTWADAAYSSPIFRPIMIIIDLEERVLHSAQSAIHFCEKSSFFSTFGAFMFKLRKLLFKS